MLSTGMDEKKKLVALGRITRPHGLKGAVHLSSYGDDTNFQGDRVLLLPDPAGNFRMLRIASARIRKPGRIVVQFHEIKDRDTAASLAGTEVLVEASSLPEPRQEDIYRHEIMGLEVVTVQGEHLGHVTGIIETPGHDVCIVTGESGREILVPAVKQIIISLDTRAGICTIDPPPGLVDANDH